MPASPLHASFPENRRSNQFQDGQQMPSDLPTSPRSPRANGSGPRQTRRLQLRNAGFRGPTINATRNMTPPSVSMPNLPTSSSWATLQQSSDAENVSPSGRRARDEGGSMRESSCGILQDIGNSATLRQPKRARGRVTSSKFWSAEGGNRESLLSDDFQSPPPSSSAPAVRSGSIRQRSVRTRAKMAPPRRSVSDQTRKYVDHLETQLSEAQAQLSAMTSPTVTREQSSKMRHLNAETRQLQEEIAAWEAKYEERVQEELDKHYSLEANLRNRVRSLEQELEDKHFKVAELEMQVESATQTMEAAETANVNLEKRLEIMSELLAASPNKIDLHAETPWRARQGRPQSMMIPRFPTVGSLATSPELRSQTQTSPMSPTPSIARLSSPRGLPSPTNLTFSPEVASSDDEESTHSDINSVICGPPPTQKPRPARRMRRFGAGSLGPKPLILPSTSHCEHLPFSAPPLEPAEGESVFPFPPRAEEMADGTPDAARPRAYSETFQEQATQTSPSPRMSLISTNGDDDARRSSLICLSPPPSRLNLSRDLGSMDSRLHAAMGHNLMEELTAIQSADFDSSEEPPVDTNPTERDDDGIPNSSPFNSDAEDERPAPLRGTQSTEDAIPTSPAGSGIIPDASSALVAPSLSKTVIHRYTTSNGKSHSRSSSRSSISTAKSKISISSIESLRSILSNMFRSPVELAKHLVQTAQPRMSIPRPLLTVQWWLVGILLGPMARRRMLGRSTKSCCGDNKSKTSDEQRSLLGEPSPTNEEGDPLAYRTAYQTPESNTSSPVRARSLVAGKGKKRAASGSKTPSPCEHQLAIQKRWKHSPFLWLKFSMTLAIAVGVAFRDGPSSLLKEAVCRCKAKEAEEGKRRGGGGVGGHARKLSASHARRLSSSGNWRKGGLVTPGS